VTHKVKYLAVCQVVGSERDLSQLVMIPASKEEVAKFRQHTDDSKWLMENYDDLRKNHAGEYVAAYKRQIIDHDRNLIRLNERVKDKPAVIQYVYREKPHLIL
jgi:hypothetical protein